jgi:hypothetical protein
MMAVPMTQRARQIEARMRARSYLRVAPSLPVYVASLRDSGYSYSAIAHDLSWRTGIDVSFETVRGWHKAWIEFGE